MRDVIFVNGAVYFSVRAVARLLDRSEITVRRWVEHGRLTASRPGRFLLVKWGELLRFVRQSRGRRDLPGDAAERIWAAARRAAKRERSRNAKLRAT